ncbi:MAG: 3-oxoadipate enol-lactonase [Pseudomonadota bacterium]
MNWLSHNGIGLHWREDGDPKCPAILFLNSLGTDLRMWDAVMGILPPGYRILRLDTRGHGLSDAPSGDYALDVLVDDAQSVMDQAGIDTAVVVGISLGGLMAKGLALKDKRRVRGLVLSNTAPRMGSHDMWTGRMAAIREEGLVAIADQILERWFANPIVTCAEGPWRSMLCRTPVDGYLGCCAALAAADLTELVADIDCPTLVIGGSHDGASPPELVRAGAERISGARYVELDGVGHLPPIEAPQIFTDQLAAFLGEINHV